MAKISSGNGAVGEASSAIEQSFIVPAGATTLTIHYNFISEEYPEYVGSAYNDVFNATLHTPDGSREIAFEEVNSANFAPVSGIPCGSGDCTWGQTDWLTASVDVMQWAGTDDTITLTVHDVGDTIYDTVVLLDNIAVENSNSSDVAMPLNSNYIVDPDNYLSFGFESDTLGTHLGIDYMTSNANPDVFAICDGTVQIVNTDRADYQQYWSGFIVVEHNCGEQVYYAYYGHVNNTENLNVAETVQKEQKIGEVRNAYQCSGIISGSECFNNITDKLDASPIYTANNHLHFGINTGLLYSGWGRGGDMTYDEIISSGWLNPTTTFGW